MQVRKCDLKGLLSTINRIDLIELDEEIAKKTLLEGVKFKQAKPTTQPVFPGTGSVQIEPRFPGAPIWNLTYFRNPNFTGRVDLLDRLHDALASELMDEIRTATSCTSSHRTP